jgi:hypothetical protein
MCVSFTRRLQILLDEERAALLEREAARTGRSVASLIRDAIDRTYRAETRARRAAAHRFLSAPPHDIGDWDAEKPRIRDEFLGSG